LLIVQSARTPAAVRHALLDSIPDKSDELVFVSAYVTLAGSQLLIDSIRKKFGAAAYDELFKCLAFSLDFGLTEPEALELWAIQKNAMVFIAGADGLKDCNLKPEIAFHPKAYLVGSKKSHFGGVIGSANMTSRGLTINTEAGWAQADFPKSAAQDLFDAIEGDVVELTAELLARYKECRAKLSPQPDSEEIAGVPEPEAVEPKALLTLWEAIVDHGLDPAKFSQFWVQINRVEGGSANQVELPRGANRFFGGTFNDYEPGTVVPIVTPTLVAGGAEWNDRPLRWHGDNRMERFNLPTLTQGGFEYAGSALLFRRLPAGRFEFIVAPWESDLARSWRTASQSAGLVHRVGLGSQRITGLI
jgi:HKD family nuclease